MAQAVIMPRQGNTVESCIITDWKVKEGDTVTAETVLCEVETDKASFEVPAETAGIVLKLLCQAGDDVPVLKPIAVIGAAGEDWETAISGETAREAAKPQREEENKDLVTSSEKLSALASLREQSAGISPRARNLAAKEALPVEILSGSGPGGRVIERDVMAALQDRPTLTVAAKAAAPGTIPPAGSGLDGRVTLADLSAASEQKSSAPHCSLLIPHFSEGKITETPIKGIRKIIAERMFKSLAESAQFTLNASARAVKLQEFRSGIKTQSAIAEELALSKITINDLILFALSRTLPRFPYMNAHKTADVIKTFERVHLGFAVDAPKGLMVPVIRNANLLSLAQISSQAKRLITACQEGTAKPEELTGSTFTVSNLGGLGITSFTPVINAPEVAILGVCSIEMKPVLPIPHTLETALRNAPLPINFEPHIGFSLTINHEAVDGAPAARFLKALCDAVAHIDLLLAAG